MATAASANKGVLACPECDLVIHIQSPAPGQWVRCPRCQYALVRHLPDDQLTPALALSALMLLPMALFLPYIGFEKNGLARNMSLPDAALELLHYHYPFLAMVILALVVILPQLYLFSVSWLTLSLRLQRPLPGALAMLRHLPLMQRWLMADVFAIAALVSLVKIIGMAKVQLLGGFWAFGAYALLLLIINNRIDTPLLWRRLAGPAPLPAGARQGISARTQGLIGCHCCGCVQTVQEGQACLRCGHRLHPRRPASLQQVWALLATAALLCFPAHLFPIMETTTLGHTMPSTIISGVILFWHHGDWPIALIIFTASVLIPFGKILSLGWLCYRARSPRPFDGHSTMRLYRVTEWIGRWSMIDVFVVAIVVALVQLGNLMNVVPGPAGLAFAAVVIVTMLAAQRFDTRLIWDQQQRLNHDLQRLQPGNSL
ncbi:paraquat-inducible protein A [Alcanivorax hongdengensis A-11-3]|uniref:Paraquat-inducible protein A n=1 Tax=Alcanivorax hongdengensis A-11-3 TaxID=1177179 RepID=L0WH59_9GAMM|nr:paraquat-inducible protein A [Alcanivorax hongdengensis]EKF75452.1 paraquat-inducible protein A [Alcanivorax hongdengensis A-11-3]